jgi:hypothetical protein
METSNPELQQKLQELEHDLEVSFSVPTDRSCVWVSSRARGVCYDTSWMLAVDRNL